MGDSIINKNKDGLSKTTTGSDIPVDEEMISRDADVVSARGCLPPVGNQVGGDYRDTISDGEDSKKGEGDASIFNRSRKLARTPPSGNRKEDQRLEQTGKEKGKSPPPRKDSAPPVTKHPDKVYTHSRLNLLGQLKRCSSAGPGKKRKVLETSMEGGKYGEEDTGRDMDPTAFIIMSAMETMTKSIQDLDKRIVENPNTKREIKEIAAKLKKCVDVLSKDSCKIWLNKHSREDIPILSCSVETQTRQQLTKSGGNAGERARNAIPKAGISGLRQ